MSEKIIAKFLVGKYFVYLIKSKNYYIKLLNKKQEVISIIPITSDDNLKDILSLLDINIPVEIKIDKK